MPSDANKFGANPFAQAMGQAKQMGEEFSRLFANMKMPAAPDMESLLAAQRRNMEAMSAANRVALEGAQALAQRHMEIMQQTMAEMTDAMRALATTDAPQAKAAQQAELLKKTYERAVTNTQEMTDLIQRANGEAVGVLNQRFAEALDEMKALIEKSGGKV